MRFPTTITSLTVFNYTLSANVTVTIITNIGIFVINLPTAYTTSWHSSLLSLNNHSISKSAFNIRCNVSPLLFRNCELIISQNVKFLNLFNNNAIILANLCAKCVKNLLKSTKITTNYLPENVSRKPWNIHQKNSF